MKKTTSLVSCAIVCAGLLPFPVQAAYYAYDNEAGDWNWNNPVNWGLTNNAGYDVEPTAADTAAFERGANFSPPGTVMLTADGFAQKIRQEFSRVQRSITIHPSQTVDRTLTLTGTSGLIDLSDAAVNFFLDGTPNTNGARLKLRINGSGGSEGTPINEGVALTISCDVSGPGGFVVKRGLDGPGVGRLILGGSNTYTGPTTVNSGRLYVDGSTAAASTVSISSGTLLGGHGTINGPVTIPSGGILSPGVAMSIATLTVNNSLSMGGDLMIKVNKSLTQSNDMVSVSGALTHSGIGTLQVLNFGAPLVTGDTFKIFNKPLVGGQTMLVLSAGTEVWTNKLAVDGTIAVLSATNPPVTGNPTNVFTWKGSVTPYNPIEVPMQDPANWIENQAPAPLSSNIFIFQGDLPPPYNWPFIDTNYGTSILIFSNNTTLNDFKILAGNNHTLNLGSYVLQDSQKLAYFGITGETPVKGSDGVTSYHSDTHHTNALGDASCGSQTEFIVPGDTRMDVYGVLRDGAGAHSRLVKSGNGELNLTGNWVLGNDPNSYSGGTVINAGRVKLAKLAGFNAIPGDVTVNGRGWLGMNNGAGHQIADSAIVTLNHSGSLYLGGYPETVGTIQGGSTSASVSVGSGTLTVTASASGTYNSGTGISDFAGSVSGSGTVVKNGAGTWGMLGANSISKVTVNAGTLKLNGKTGTGAVKVNASGTLLGQGIIAGTVTVASGGTIAAGFGAGKVTFSSGLNLNAGGNGPTNIWELAALKDGATGVAGTDFDQIVLTGGTLALGGSGTLYIGFTGSATAPTFSDPFWRSSHTWRIILLSGGSNPGSSNFGRIKNGNYPAGDFSTTADPSGIVLTYTPNPAPPVLVMYDDPFSFTNGSYGFAVQGQTGQVVVIEASVNLTDWLPIHTNLLGDLGECLFYDLHTGQFSHRYYRARLYAGQLPPPVMLAGEAGIVGAQFRLAVGAVGGQEVVVEASTNLADWLPILTNTVGIGPCYFYDPKLTDFTQRFYRVFYVTP